jgi:LmbE family N-acetylglucosaminyl deacetylase
MTPAQLGALREGEQERASSILGVKDVRFLRHDDGDLQFGVPALREEIVRLIRPSSPKTRHRSRGNPSSNSTSGSSWITLE